MNQNTAISIRNAKKINTLASHFFAQRFTLIVHVPIAHLQRLITQEVVAVGHNKSWAASGRQRSLGGPKGHPDIYCWPCGPAKD